MRILASLIVISAFVFSFFVRAEDKQPLTLKESLQIIKSFPSQKQAGYFFAAVDSEIGFAKWLEFYAKKNIDINKLPLDQIKIEGHKVFVPGVEKPFIFLNEHAIVSYKGLVFAFNYKSMPDATYERMKTAWEEFKDMDQVFALLSFIGIPGVVFEANAKYAQSMASLVVSAGPVINEQVKKAGKNSKGAELKCDEKGIGKLMDLQSQKEIKEIEQICSGGTDLIKKSNEVLSATKQQMIKGDVQY